MKKVYINNFFEIEFIISNHGCVCTFNVIFGEIPSFSRPVTSNPNLNSATNFPDEGNNKCRKWILLDTSHDW